MKRLFLPAPTQFMIYSRRNLAVRLLPDTSDCPEAVLPIQGLKSVKAIDFDPVDNFLYWVNKFYCTIYTCIIMSVLFQIEGKTQSIKRADVIGSHTSIVVQGNTDTSPFDIVIDSIGRLLFWSCTKQDVINVTSLNNSGSLGVVHHRDGEKPRFLALHPGKR